jgi:DNA-binding NarL/FixJ family response regulator
MWIRVLLVDNSEEFLGAATRFLSAESSMKIVGQTHSWSAVLELVAALKPELVLMDLVMPGCSGLELTRLIKAQPDAPRVVILTLYDHPGYRAAALSAKADAYLAKSDFGDKLLPLVCKLFKPETDATRPTTDPRSIASGSQ